MTALALSVPCTAGGTTQISLNFECERSGSSNDRAAFRILRQGGNGDIVLPGEPQFVLASNRDVRTWSWLDVGVPTSETYTYVLQIRKIDGAGTFYAMTYTAVHYGK